MSRGKSAAALALFGLLTAFNGAAHPNLAEYVQHDITLEANGSYLDVTARVTFFGRHAELQALFLDSDGDGRYSSAERKAFGKVLLADAEKQLALRIGGQALPLLPLHDPEIRAPGGAIDRPGDRFEVQLRFFARLPRASGTEATVEVRDGLFPDFPVLAGFRVSGKEGMQLKTESSGHGLTRPAGSEEVLVLEAILQDGSTAPPAEARQEGGTASNPGEQGETS